LVILTELKVVGKSATSIFVAQAQVTEELQFSDPRGQFPFFAAVKVGHEFLNVCLSVAGHFRLAFAFRTSHRFPRGALL
jgi:hypothetical protein